MTRNKDMYPEDEEIRMCSNCGHDGHTSCIGKENCHIDKCWIPKTNKLNEKIPGSSLPLLRDTPDLVNSPEHYTSGGIECIEAIRAALTADEFRGFIKGNIIKYAWREKIKNGDEDLKKIVKYIELLFRGEKK